MPELSPEGRRQNRFSRASAALQPCANNCGPWLQGSGEPALSIAKALPQCQVVATDLAPGMVEQAKRRAEAQGITNLRCGNPSKSISEPGRCVAANIAPGIVEHAKRRGQGVPSDANFGYEF